MSAALDRGRITGYSSAIRIGEELVREYATAAGISPLAPHDLRRSCAKLCHVAGGELQTTESYLGCKQRIRSAVNDRIGIEPGANASVVS